MEKEILKGSNLTVANVLKDFEQFLNNDYSYNTKSEYSRTTKSFLMNYFDTNDLLNITDKPIPMIKEQDIKSWYKHLLSDGYTNTSLVRFRQSLKKYFEFLNVTYFMEVPEIDNIELPKVELNTDFNVLTNTEVLSIVDEADTVRSKLIIMLLYEATMKRNELINCKKSDIDIDRLVVRINKPNGEIDRYGYFSDRTRELIENYVKEWEDVVNDINSKRRNNSYDTKPMAVSEYLFQTIKSPQMSYAPIFTAIKEATYQYYYKLAVNENDMNSKDAQVYAEEKSSAVNTETFRHSRRAWLFAQGKTIEQVQTIMGDNNSTLCKRYLKIAMKLYPESFR